MEREIKIRGTFIDRLGLCCYRNNSSQCEVLQEGRMNGKAYCSIWFLALVQSLPTVSCSLKVRKEQQRQNLHHKQPPTLPLC